MAKAGVPDPGAAQPILPGSRNRAVWRWLVDPSGTDQAAPGRRGWRALDPVVGNLKLHLRCRTALDRLMGHLEPVHRRIPRRDDQDQRVATDDRPRTPGLSPSIEPPGADPAQLPTRGPIHDHRHQPHRPGRPHPLHRRSTGGRPT